jgi:multidrug efflux pump subunit AcrA (membrane-fusion protein)
MKMSYRTGLLFIPVVALLLSSCNKENTTHPVEKKLVEAVYASGKVIPSNDYKIYALTDGTILQRNVTEGDSVTAGQILFSIDNTTQQAQTATARMAFQMAADNYGDNSPVLQDLKYQVTSLQLKLADDSVNYIRQRNLYDAKSTSKFDFDRAKLRYETSVNDLKSAKDRLTKTRNQVKLDYENAKNQLNINNTQTGYYDVKSSINGLVYELYKKPGEAVRRFDPLAAIGNKGSFYIQLWVDELDINKVQVGQQVAITMDLHKGKTFKAKVTKIYPVLNEQNQSIRIDAEFTEAPPRLIANALVEANIVIAEKDKVLTLPKKYVMGDSVKVKGQDKYVHIKKGLEDSADVEVLDGLTPASEVVIPN